MAGSRTSGLILISVILIAISIATSAMGLFMDSWRVDDEDERDDDEPSRSWGLTTIAYDCSVIDDDEEEEWCKMMMIFMVEGVEDSQDNYDDIDDVPSKNSADASDMCDNLEEIAMAFEIDDDAEIKEDIEACEDTKSAGETTKIVLWIGFGLACLSSILCIVSAISRDSVTRIIGGITALSGGLVMGLSVLLYSMMLPDGIAGEDNDWQAGLNFYLTLVGGFLSLVAGFIAFLAKRSGGRSYSSPAYQQQDFNQQEQFYNEQTQYYQQPDPYQQW